MKLLCQPKESLWNNAVLSFRGWWSCFCSTFSFCWPGEWDEIWHSKQGFSMEVQSTNHKCLVLFSENAVCFLNMEKADYRSLVLFYLIKSCSHLLSDVPFQSLKLQLCENCCFVIKSSLGDWAAYNKVFMFVFNAVYRLLFVYPWWPEGLC